METSSKYSLQGTLEHLDLSECEHNENGFSSFSTFCAVLRAATGSAFIPGLHPPRSLCWFEAGGGWKGKDFGESNLMYHLTWKFCFQQGLFMDPFCSLLHLTDSLLKYFKVLSQRAVTVILGTTHKEELSLYNLPAGFSCRGIISFAAAALWPCSEPSCAQPHSLCHPPALCP